MHSAQSFLAIIPTYDLESSSIYIPCMRVLLSSNAPASLFRRLTSLTRPLSVLYNNIQRIGDDPWAICVYIRLNWYVWHMMCLRYAGGGTVLHVQYCVVRLGFLATD